MRQLEEDSSGGYSLIGTAGGADGEPSSLGRFDAVVLSDAMAGRSGRCLLVLPHVYLAVNPKPSPQTR